MTEENKVIPTQKRENIKHGYGWVADLPDHRDKMYSVSIPAPLPQIVDLRPMDSPIFDQLNLGSCTANSLAGALQFLEKKDKVKYMDLSRLFIYYSERVIENTVNYDSGATLRDGIKALASLGTCSATCWPYIISKFTDQPYHSCYVEAAKHRILSYYRLNTLDDMRHCLSSGYPFVFGFSVFESFESDKVANTGIVPMPKSDEQLLGGHATTAIGYNDTDKRFIVRNSWGTNWGQKGYFTIPYEYLTDRTLSDDLWTIRKEQGF